MNGEKPRLGLLDALNPFLYEEAEKFASQPTIIAKYIKRAYGDQESMRPFERALADLNLPRAHVRLVNYPKEIEWALSMLDSRGSKSAAQMLKSVSYNMLCAAVRIAKDEMDEMK